MSTKKFPSVSDSVSFRVSRALRKAASKKFSAFTLVELIVVITILAILATIGFLALSGYTQDAKDASVKANVRSVMTAISAESAVTNNSPRYYVVHDAGAALADGTVAFVDGSPAILTWGSYGTAGTNYSAGNPDWAKLKLNPDKFKLSSLPAWLPSAFAAYDSKAVSVGAVDAALAPTASGRSRSSSFFQVAGTAPATGLISVVGNFPSPTSAQTALGATAGLVKAPTGTGALVDGGASGTSGSSSGGGASKYPGCDANDIYLTGSNQYWAACNVGASNAWTVGVAFNNTGATNQPSDYNSAIRNTLGSYFQWGRNEDVTSVGSGAQVSTGSSVTVLGYFAKGAASNFDWLTDAAKNNNLWGGGSTSLGSGTFTGQIAGNQSAMTGPCAAGYHVPTQAEWWSAISTLNSGLTNTATWQNDTTLATTLKLPLTGYRDFLSAAFYSQGTYGSYWASSPTGANGYYVALSATQVFPAINSGRAFGFSVRCLKN